MPKTEIKQPDTATTYGLQVRPCPPNVRDEFRRQAASSYPDTQWQYLARLLNLASDMRSDPRMKKMLAKHGLAQ